MDDDEDLRLFWVDVRAEVLRMCGVETGVGHGCDFGSVFPQSEIDLVSLLVECSSWRVM